MIHRLAFVPIFACFASSFLLAAESPTADEKGVKTAIESYVKAFNKGDAEAVANHWAEDAEYQLPTGDRVQGREAIRAAFAKMFAGESPPKIRVVKARVRVVTKDVAIEEGEVEIQSGDEAPEVSTYVAVHVRKGKEWKLNTVREVATPSAQQAVAEHPLQDLEWLVGSWRENSKSGAHSRFAWSKNRTFLTCQFKVPLPDGDVLEGTQVIGWDPESKVIRSWLFDQDGGFGEGLWTKTEKGWSIKFVQVLPDGRRASATNTYERIDSHTFAWKSTGRKVDGQLVADVPTVHATRILRPADQRSPGIEE